ncbi:FAD-binding oxidoreductase [Streptomyces sp. NPDC001812]|uniref:FAD-binding oxidoreductase n=1 Tax=Streptomyces cathayae TaxID=3031124 RepID=A0ABY8K255_9ACTN|nr:FAD-binding oxidoreductase [Streptomyces sp. HUAS 5]WGD40961.1 FAD-binding oxidoreductase [Streptomyces sp. HUAS 5]
MSEHRSESDKAALSPEEVRKLADSVTGEVFLPDEPGYTERVNGFDRAVEHRPAVVVAVANAQDVVTSVGFARDHDWAVAVQTTGHGAALPADENTLFLATRGMNGVEVDPERRVARLEAGVLWEEVLPAAAEHGLAPLNGSAPFVGAVSYTLGGGIGVLSRRHGYAADHVRRIEVVTADGELRVATQEENADLFWALRGGKGNFGVVTAIEVELFEVSRIYGGGLFFPAESAAEALHFYSEWAAGMPEEMSSSFFMLDWPDADGVPQELRGKFALHLRLCYLGSPEEGERLVQPLRDLAPTLLDTVVDMPYTEVGTIHNDPPTPGCYHINTFQLSRFDHEVVDAVLAQVGPGKKSAVGLELRQLGGALARPPKVPNAVAHVDAPFQVYAAGVLGVGEDDAVLADQDRVGELFERWDSGTRMLNFMAGVAHTDAAYVSQAYTPEAYARLRALKTTWDPGNMFRVNHNIPPVSTEV